MDALQITDGDLVISNGSFATVTGPAKVQQDIMIGVLTPYGSDRFHPRYGSVFSNYIGGPAGAITTALVQAELTRVIQNYQRVQLGQLQRATLNGQTSPFSQGELVQSIGAITVTQSLDSYFVTGSVTTTSGQQVNVSTTITSGT